MTRLRIAVEFPLLIALTALAARAAFPQDVSFEGLWKGDSLCQIKESPCHDEVGVYHVKKTAPGSFEFAMNKVVGGKEEFMGSLQCSPGEDSNSLVCHQNESAVWTWKVKGDSMSGTLMYRGQLYRKITLTRAK
jgi:hypothetical protein